MAIEAQVKKWGNSVGIILPKELVKRQKLKENDTIRIQVVKKAKFSKAFGALESKVSAQKFKDMVREEW